MDTLIDILQPEVKPAAGDGRFNGVWTHQTDFHPPFGEPRDADHCLSGHMLTALYTESKLHSTLFRRSHRQSATRPHGSNSRANAGLHRRLHATQSGSVRELYQQNTCI